MACVVGCSEMISVVYVCVLAQKQKRFRRLYCCNYEVSKTLLFCKANSLKWLSMLVIILYVMNEMARVCWGQYFVASVWRADMLADGSHFYRLGKQIILAVLEEAVAEPKQSLSEMKPT
jgi:hypothetical protein